MYATAACVAWDPGSQREHEQLLAAVRKSDIERACRLPENHIADAVETLIKGLAVCRFTIARAD
jgi:DNA-binding GntR family transcriptional regulator